MALVSIAWFEFGSHAEDELQGWDSVAEQNPLPPPPPRRTNRELGDAVAKTKDKEWDSADLTQVLRLRVVWPDGRELGESVRGFVTVPGWAGQFPFKTDDRGEADVFLGAIPKLVQVDFTGPFVCHYLRDCSVGERQGYLADQSALVEEESPPTITVRVKLSGKIRGQLQSSAKDLFLEGCKLSCSGVEFRVDAKWLGNFKFTDLRQGICRIRIGSSLMFDEAAILRRYGQLPPELASDEMKAALTLGPKLSADGRSLCFDVSASPEPERYLIDVKAVPRISGQIVAIDEDEDEDDVPIVGAQIRVLSLSWTPVSFTRFRAGPQIQMRMTSSNFLPFNQESGEYHSDDEGSFTLPSGFAADCILQVYAKGYGVFRSEVIRAGQYSEDRPFVVGLSKTMTQHFFCNFHERVIPIPSPNRLSRSPIPRFSQRASPRLV